MVKENQSGTSVELYKDELYISCIIYQLKMFGRKGFGLLNS